MKIIRFVRVSSVSVSNIAVDYKSTLTNHNDLEENFKISDPINLDTYLESKLFHFLDRKQWTLNELIFFAKNNNICLVIYDDQERELVKYGECSNVCNGFKVNDKCLMINNKFIYIN